MIRAVRRAVELLCAALMAAIAGVVFLQVLTRYVFQHPFDWPEEVARYCFVWVAMLGAALALDRGAHFSIDLLTARFRPAVAARLAIAMDLVCAGFCAVLAWQGVLLAWAVREQPSVGLELSMAWAYAAIPVGAALMAASLAGSGVRRARRPPAGTGA